MENSLPLSVHPGSNASSIAILCGQEACLHREDLAVPMPLQQASGEGNELCASQKSVARMPGVLVSMGLQLWSQVFILSGCRLLVCILDQIGCW